jgi:hypothetical protein
MEDLGRKQGSESKNANLQVHPAKPAGWRRVGVPGLTLDDYPSNTIRWETLFVKGKGQEIWGWNGEFLVLSFKF